MLRWAHLPGVQAPHTEPAHTDSSHTRAGARCPIARKSGSGVSYILCLNAQYSVGASPWSRRIRLKRAALVTVDPNGRRIVVVSSDDEDASRFVRRLLLLSCLGKTYAHPRDSASVVAQKGSQSTQLLPGKQHTTSRSQRMPTGMSGCPVCEE